jgi:hypothetical protein
MGFGHQEDTIFWALKNASTSFKRWVSPFAFHAVIFYA